MKTASRPLTSLLALCTALFALCFCSGCTSTTYQDPSGARFARTSFLNRQSIGKVEMKAGDKSLSIEGYTNEQTEIAAAVSAAVVKAALTPAAK